MNQDFPVISTTDEATVVWSKGQIEQGRCMSSLHLNWHNRVFTDGPQPDDGVPATGCQQSPIIGELDWIYTALVAQQIIAVEWRSDIRFLPVNWETLGSKSSAKIMTLVLSIDCYWCWSSSLAASSAVLLTDFLATLCSANNCSARPLKFKCKRFLNEGMNWMRKWVAPFYLFWIDAVEEILGLFHFALHLLLHLLNFLSNYSG